MDILGEIITRFIHKRKPFECLVCGLRDLYRATFIMIPKTKYFDAGVIYGICGIKCLNKILKSKNIKAIPEKHKNKWGTKLYEMLIGREVGHAYSVSDGETIEYIYVKTFETLVDISEIKFDSNLRLILSSMKKSGIFNEREGKLIFVTR